MKILFPVGNAEGTCKQKGFGSLLALMKLSRIERIILIIQYEILNALKPGRYDAQLSALQGNLELALSPQR